VPLLVSLLLIEIAAELLHWQAAGFQAVEANTRGAVRETIPGPVHEVDRTVTARGIII
jgi:hypothetical protein